MLCPEVWNFSPPKHSSTFSIGDWKTSDDIKSVARKRYFNHLVSVVLPDTVIVPQNLIESLSNDCDYYRVSNFPITAFINSLFLGKFIRSGQFTALTIGTRVDCDDCIAVTPTGHLVLSLLKQSYEELGLDGKPSAFCRMKKRATRYLVTIDLKTINPDSKKYERIHSALLNFQSEHVFDMILAWDPPLGQEKICPSSIAAFFEKLNINITPCSPKFTQRRVNNIKVPVVKWNNDDVGCEPEDVLEWLGAFSFGVDLSGGEEENESIFSMEHTVMCGQTAHLKGKGFYPPSRIIKFLENLEVYIANRKFPWAAVFVAGFEDAPVSPGLREHRRYGAFGDNSYTFLLHPEGKYIISTLEASQKLLNH